MTSESITTSWRNAWRDSTFRVRTLITAPLLVATLAILARFLEGIEERQGVVLSDPVLGLFTPVDLTWLTFALIYAGLFLAVGVLLGHPRRLLFAFQAYIIMAVFRIIVMGLLPLDPPPAMIPLQDPLVEFFGTGKLLTRDLFFSGHTATLFLLVLVSPRGLWKGLFLGCTLLVAAAVLLQHVHYTIDVFAAPFFAYAAFKTAQRLGGGADPGNNGAGDPPRTQEILSKH